ncbi:hypothetical protein A8F94_18785 [Bacillus sp. FJAT-27225]|nr:hypothetical protein A8F94_18785 [Bacillus sp. FJAT-27225]
MILAGAVTFSVTNVVLFEDATKKVIKESASAISEGLKKADIIGQTAKAEAPKTTVKMKQTKPSQERPKTKELNSATKSDQESGGIAAGTRQSALTEPVTVKPVTTKQSGAKPQSTVTINKPAATAPTKPAATATQAPTKPAATATQASTKKGTAAAKPQPEPTKPPASAAPKQTIKPAPVTEPKTTGPNPNASEKATTNRGKEVSQAAKEKTAAKQGQKENNETKNLNG